MSGQRGFDVALFNEIRSNPLWRWSFTALGAGIGLIIVWIHWLGLVLGAALVALPRRSLPRGIVAGVGFGILVAVVHVGSLVVVSQAAVTTFFEMGPILLLSLAIPLIAGCIGGLFRGLIP